MPRQPHSTHAVTLVEDVVTKSFLTSDRGEAEREWSALGHLARYADGLAPRPIAAGLTDRPAWIRMTWVAGATPRVLAEAAKHWLRSAEVDRLLIDLGAGSAGSGGLRPR